MVTRNTTRSTSSRTRRTRRPQALIVCVSASPPPHEVGLRHELGFDAGSTETVVVVEAFFGEWMHFGGRRLSGRARPTAAIPSWAARTRGGTVSPMRTPRRLGRERPWRLRGPRRWTSAGADPDAASRPYLACPGGRPGRVQAGRRAGPRTVAVGRHGVGGTCVSVICLVGKREGDWPHWQRKRTICALLRPVSVVSALLPCVVTGVSAPAGKPIALTTDLSATSTVALVERRTHRADIIAIEGKSWRHKPQGNSRSSRPPRRRTCVNATPQPASSHFRGSS